MKDLSINNLIEMQNELQERMKGKWTPIIPENGHFSLLWMYEELGEIVAIIKKRGDAAIMDDKTVRAAFAEEMSDVLMYYVKLMMSFKVSADELSEAYIAKHEKNMRRDFLKEHEEYLGGNQ
jgi:dUTPase.